MPSLASPRKTAVEQAITGIANGFVTRNRDGYWVIGDPNRGCQFCGDVTAVEGREGGKTVLYHPSVECCPRAVERQIGWRSAELERVNLAWSEDDRRVRALEAEANNTSGFKGADNAAVAGKASRSLTLKIRDVYQPTVTDLGKEISRLKGVLEAMK